MKICIYFKPKAKNDNYEGARLRKTLKGALEVNDITYAKDIVDNYDLIHFMSIDDELKINDAKENHIPIVFSALNCESDESAKMLVVKDGKIILPSKTLKVLNNVDKILVSDNLSKEFLEDNGVTTDIEIVSPGVNLSRFEFQSQLEEGIFYNYFQLERTKKFIVSSGTAKDKRVTDLLISLAKKCPDYKFFHITNNRMSKIMHIAKGIPNNLKFCTLLNSELYCSMMKLASIYIALDNTKHSPITLLDAAASKTQIIALSPLSMNEELLKDLHAYTCDDINKMSELINNLLSGKLEFTIDQAYEYAKENSISKVGKKLIKVYEEILNRRNTK